MKIANDATLPPVTGKFFFQLTAVYVFLYIFPFPLGHLPFGAGTTISDWATSFWQWLTMQFAGHILGYTDELSFVGRGSGDTLYDYLLLGVRVVLALTATLLWSVLDKSGRYGRPMRSLLVLMLRYYLAFTMFTYGFSKVFYLQFPELSLINLTRSFGDSSPMGLLWKFMGHSEPYSIFTGLLEVFGGCFLLFRRTKVLGAMLTFAIMLNVFVLNMSYDVPVKLFSFHLWLMSIFVLLPDWGNIANFFILNRSTRPLPIKDYFSDKKRRLLAHGFKGILVFHVLFHTLNAKWEVQKQYGKRAPSHALYGVYEVQDFVVNGDTLPPLTTDTLRWKKLIIDKKNSLIIKMDDSRVGLRHEMDSMRNSISLTPFLEDGVTYVFDFEKTDSLLHLSGSQENNTFRIKSIRYGREDFFLIRRGFNWINEYPMQR